MTAPQEPLYQTDNPHHIDPDQIIKQLDSPTKGLSQSEAQRRLEKVGYNRLPAAEKEGILKRFFKHFHNLLIYVLLAAALLTALLGHWIDTGVILAVVIINAAIGFIQEGKAEEALEGIRKMLSLQALVLREGRWVEINAEELVPGDRVKLRSGNRVPADMRLIETTHLQIEESALTGESMAADKSTAAVAADAGIGDRYGMAFSGTLITTGRGIGVVTATGIHTEIGRINTMIAEVEKIATPLTRQMNSFGKLLSVVIVGMAVVMWFIGWFFHEYTVGELFLSAIGFAVAAIPEGLPAIFTITLALGVQRMARRNAITRRLSAIETLGSVTVICSDKTGTLTRNEMTARHLVTAGDSYEVGGTGYAPEGIITHQDHGDKALNFKEHPEVFNLIETMAVCNDSEIVEKDQQWQVTGEPTEGALRTLAAKAAVDDSHYERVATIPFESHNKFMATLNRVADGELMIFVKGAPDQLLDRSSFQRSTANGDEPLDRSFWEDHVEKLSSQGLRVLAAAVRPAKEGQDALNISDIDSDLTFLGLVGIIDPPRPEAINSIAICHQAGIQVKMITGDHAGTAVAIGREMGITETDQVITGTELEKASDEELHQLAKDYNIFARTSPEHKLRLVKALQANGEVVAMTGDGVNDAPALKRADVGIAMGIKGTEATKEAAEVVLADDNFTSIERAIEEGRTIYDNLRKAILFILPTNGAEGLVILTAIILGIALPLTPVQILWVNMVTAVTLALALAFEPPEPGVMERPPRQPGTSILGGIFVWRIIFVSILIGGATIAIFLYERSLDLSLDMARTLAVNTLVCGQAFYLFNSRYLKRTSLKPGRLIANPAAWVAVAVLACFQLLFVYAPIMQLWFGSAPLEARHWLIPLGIGAAVFLIVEAEKLLTRRWL
ncbi:cation-transporting P-type ATPase [Pelovirga terrestris]|uniref:Cation-transporting P-type ATPase n=1 Tax=Pelovirga terrestris TaxID=2771352 RepID=A0A8J6QVH0_9BACT|nr:cation-transporting P-type ATPase [Pelovirga terrestris]MBD1401690.1 cation-transporting P-type ATPase [Pelovirga terrestris]